MTSSENDKSRKERNKGFLNLDVEEGEPNIEIRQWIGSKRKKY